METRDTIAAIATAAGHAGVGVVRISGANARRVGERVAGSGLRDRRVAYRRFRDASGETIDAGVAIFFAAPRSFTGEDVIELQGHGGPVVLHMLLEAALAAGARAAGPGEFTERAYLNGKLDLVQAEALADLIAGASEAAVRGATRSLSGAFSRRVHAIDAAVLELRTFVEAAIDFPEEEVDFLVEGQVAERVRSIAGQLAALREDCAQGVILRDGIALALLGPPNVGKSSLLNRLTGESRAIVTEIPGTTRDVIRAQVSIGGLPVEVVDTAGLREAGDMVEAEGVRRALEAGTQADLVLVVNALDGSDAWAVSDYLPEDEAGPRRLNVLNKLDLAADPESAEATARSQGAIPVSALTGEGMAELRDAIGEAVGFSPGGNVFTARKRHLAALEDALAAAERALMLARDAVSGELIAEELRAVHAGLGEIVGEVSSDELLGEIFSKFCIGK